MSRNWLSGRFFLLCGVNTAAINADHVKGDQRDDHDRDSPLQKEEHANDCNQGHDVADECHQLPLNQTLDQLDIACDARHDLARLSLVVVGERQALKVLPGRKPQVEDKAVPDPGQGVTIGEA